MTKAQKICVNSINNIVPEHTSYIYSFKDINIGNFTEKELDILKSIANGTEDNDGKISITVNGIDEKKLNEELLKYIRGLDVEIYFENDIIGNKSYNVSLERAEYRVVD